MTGAGPYVQNELLSRLVGNRMCSVEFVLNDSCSSGSTVSREVRGQWC